MGVDGGELGELGDHVFGGVDQDAGVGLAEHRGVVERIAGGDDVVVEALEGFDGVALLVGEAELVTGDAVVFDDQAVAEERRPVELADERDGELLEGVGEDDELDAAAEGVEEIDGAGERGKGADDLLDFGEGDAVAIEDIDTVAHQLVVIGFVTRGAAELGDAGAFGDGDPDFGREDALHVEGDDALFHWTKSERDAGGAWQVRPRPTRGNGAVDGAAVQDFSGTGSLNS